MKVKVRTQQEVKLPGMMLEEAHPAYGQAKVQPQTETHGTPLLVLFGSAAGTAEAVALELADIGRAKGFETTIATLNEYKENLPGEGLVLLVSSSYEGRPTENGEQFMDWLAAASVSLAGVRYAVFGCGDTNWPSTYQKVPVTIDRRLEELGAERICRLGQGDANAEFETEFSDWQELMWTNALQVFGIKPDEQPALQEKHVRIRFVSGVTEEPVARMHLAKKTKVLENRELQHKGSGRHTRHLDIRIPKGFSYTEGDHLAVVPKNSPALVKRVLDRLGLTGHEKIEIESAGRSMPHLPAGKAVNAFDVFSYCTELQEPATRRQLHDMAVHTPCPPHRSELEMLLENHREEVQEKRRSLLELLEQYESCQIDAAWLFSHLPPLKPRFYSIASSPKKQPETVSITVSVLQDKARSGRGLYTGTASMYLMELAPGEDIAVFFRTQRAFRLPENPERPIIMVGPGTGIAPFRGFLQARLELKRAGTALGKALLFFGCRDEELDYLYRDELNAFEREGVVTLHTAFSRMDTRPKQYVQDLLKEQREEVFHLLTERDGSFYLCGEGSRMAPQVEQTLKDIYCALTGQRASKAEAWLTALGEQGRFIKDVW